MQINKMIVDNLSHIQNSFFLNKEGLPQSLSYTQQGDKGWKDLGRDFSDDESRIANPVFYQVVGIEPSSLPMLASPW